MANSINATSTGNGGIITTGDDSGVLNIQTNETTAISIDASQNATFTNGVNLPNTFGFKNRLINGGMVIDQRNAGAEVNPAVNGTYYLDRWAVSSGAAGKFKIKQNAGAVTTPAGFINYLGVTSLSAYSVGSSEQFGIYQPVEGLNISDLGWGTSSAKTVTLSFVVYSSLTGTFGGSLRNSSADRSYPFTYTINAANTWETKTVTIAGDTTGTWLTTNGVGIYVYFGLGVGSTLSGTANAWAAANYPSATGATSVVGTNGATFYITGVQLEKGTQATSFDFRSYGTELALCQRYYEKTSGYKFITVIDNTAPTRFAFETPFLVFKRTDPITTVTAIKVYNGLALTLSTSPSFKQDGSYISYGTTTTSLSQTSAQTATATFDAEL